MRKILIIFFPLLLNSCALWPYKSDFDCPHPEGEACKSLYEVNQLTDAGKYTPKPHHCTCGGTCGK